MTDDDLPLTRRNVLAGLAGAGALGSGAGAFTSATLGDRELLRMGTTAGAAGISVDCEAADCAMEDGVLQFAIDVVPGELQRRSFTLAVDDNPVRVWARTDCPPEADEDDHHWPPDDWEPPADWEPPDDWPTDRPGGSSQNGSTGNQSNRSLESPPGRTADVNGSTVDTPDGPTPTFGGGWSPPPLADVLNLRVSVADPCGAGGTRLYPEDDDWGTLRDFQSTFADGRRLDADEPCFESGDDVCLELEYYLPWWYAFVGEGEEAELELELYAEQCRHVEESAAENPFEAADCGSEPDPGPCPDCTKLGKLEVEDDGLETTVYDFDELYGPFEGDGHDYALDVLDVTTKDDGEPVCVEFALLRDGEEALEMCEVRVKGGNRGDPSEHDPWVYDVDPPATRTSGEVCTGEIEAGNSGSTHQPGISYVEVSVCDDGSQDGGEDE
jgi:hypothetical protein